MGNLIDAFTKEDRIPVRFSELYTIIRQAAQAELMENAVACGVPHHYIQQMINGKNDLLEEYKSTGVLPEEIPAMQQTIEAYRNTGYAPEKVKELDALYLKKCEEVNALEKELWDSRTPANKEKMRMNNTVVNILGTEYRIEFKNIEDDPILKNANGYTDPTVKKIVICNKEPDCDVEDFDILQRKVIRHEIIHAYFEESSVSTNVENLNQGVPELYVDWFAIQAPKIYKTYVKLGILDVNTAKEVFDDYIDRAGTTALARGMNGSITPGELIDAMRGEVSELFEEFRSEHKVTETYYGEDGKPEGVPSELADVVIYCFIMADLYQIDLAKALDEKMAYNVVRAKREVK